MKIVRGNTLPDYSLLSMNAGSAEIDGYQHHEKWQYKPIMGVNVEDILGEDILNISSDDFERALKRISDSKLLPSLFNLERTFDDSTTVLINTMTEAVALLNQEEYKKYKTISLAPDYHDKTIEYCQDKGISVQAAMPFGGSKRSNELSELQRLVILKQLRSQDLTCVFGTKNIQHLCQNISWIEFGR